MKELTFSLDGDSATPMYDQLARHIVSEIRAGRLREGDRLPSKRDLCAHLRISRSTVESAYAILTAEGYVSSRPRSGYYVCAYEEPARAASPAAHISISSGQAERREETPPEEKPGIARFSTSEVDTAAFPYASWARLNKEVIRAGAPLLQRGHPQGDECLRRALCDFLHQYRCVNCAPDQIVIGSGMEYLLRVLIELMEPDAKFALENPGYGALYRALEISRRPYAPIALDGAGMRPDQLAQSGARIAYVTPSHQFPTGLTMPAGRRAALLGWAAARPGRYIIEDDYDSEFRYITRPIPSMQGTDENGRVIYVGTFSRSLAPSIRVAYLALPPALIDRYRALLSHTSSTVSRFEQHTLCRFIEEGFYARHLRRMGNLYRRRRDLLLDGLSSIKGLQVTGAGAGLHFMITLDRLDTQTLLKRALEAGVALRPLDAYMHGGEARPSTLVLGYAGMDDKQIVDACARLRAAWA